MAIQYVGGQTTTVTTTAPVNTAITFALTGGLASTPADGDIVFVSYNVASGSDITMSTRIATSGYNLVTELYANDTIDANIAVFYKNMGSTPDSAVDVSGKPAAGTPTTVNISVFRGVSSASPLDVTTTTSVGINSGNPNPAAVTPATSGNVILLFGNAGVFTTTRSFTSASTAYMSSFLQQYSTAGSGGILSGSGYVTGQTAGVSYDPADWAIDASDTAMCWTAATLVLRPAPAGIAGTASGDIGLTGAASGVARILGASSGDISLTGTSVAAASIAATAAGTIDLSGAASGGGVKIIVAAGTIGFIGSATGAALVIASASGQLDLTGATQGGVAIVAASSSQISLDGSADGEVSYNTGEASGTLAFTGAAIGAIYVQGSVSGAISFSLASYGKHLWLQQPPNSEDWVAQAANDEIWQPVPVPGTAWE